MQNYKIRSVIINFNVDFLETILTISEITNNQRGKMAKKILGVIAGYVTMAVFIFLTFTVLYLILGADGSFEPGSYNVSTTWLVLSFLLGLIAAIIGGFICVLITKDRRVAIWLAGIVLVLGFVLAIPALCESEDERNKVREGEASNMEAMQNAKQPPITLILNPVIGAIGVFAGSGLWKEKKSET